MILSAKKLSIGYSDGIVCKDINFCVNKGDFLCIIGENGTGKSTLIKTILGLNKSIKGEIRFSEDYDAQRVGYLPQISEMQKDFPATVKEVVMSGFVGNKKWKLFFNKAEKKLAQDYMRNIGIADLQKKSFRELSGGQQQRVLLTRALCSTDNLLVLDEPTNGLDAKFTKSFYSLLKNLNKQGITIIMVSHNIEKVTEISSHILCLKKDGCFFGTSAEYVESENAQTVSGGAQ
ncbi:MAG: ABC transporter ATP-binding protein [Clostridiales bacterium]|nr:ABC transporter ATP-binding protein [Clostridiales bacterium]